MKKIASSLLTILSILPGIIFASFFIPSPAEATTATYLVDFGLADSTYPTNTTGWNNITNPASGAAIQLVKSTGATSSTTLQITNSFFSFTSECGGFSSCANINGTTTSTLYPVTATKDSFFLGTFTSTDNSAAMSVGGLNNSNTYDFRFYASRTAGDSANRTTNYTINGTTVSLNATNNINGYVEITGITPSSGSISISVAKNASATYGYLGVLEITEHITNSIPTANAGTDQSVTLPATSTTLSGSGSDIDGTIASYAWSFISGPVTPTIVSASSASTSVTGMSQTGPYTFRLTVTDDVGATATDDVVVTVQNDKPQSKFNVSEASQPVIGWTNLAGNPANSTPTVTDSVTGFGFRSTGIANWNSTFGNDNAQDAYGESADDGGGFAFPAGVVANLWYNYDDLFTGVYQTQLFGLDSNKRYTIVILGSRGTANSATAPRKTDYNLKGISVLSTQTLDNWRNTSHTVTFTSVQPNASGIIDIAINRKIDNTGGSFGYLNGITVTEESNSAPTANAGTDQSITQPTTSTTLSGSGSDTDGTIASYAWSFISGPATPTIVSASSASTSVTGLSSAGTYAFRLTVTDNQGATATDDINVTVNATGNQTPTANAGSDQVVNLPTTSTTLSGSGSDTDGTIASYAWSFISGPATPTIVSASSASTSVTGLSSAGTYVFRLTVTDNGGAIGTDDVNVVINTVPTANAGSDQSITLPTAATTLTGSGSDTDGSIASYSWVNTVKPSGATVPTITSATSASTAVSGLSTAGTYTFQLTVTDNRGATATDTMNVVVNAGNQSPTANAGSDQNVTMPVSSITLSGSGSDTDGTIASYAWTETSSNYATINSASSATATVTDLAAGTYTFRLTVTDNQGATGTDDVTVTVNAQSFGSAPAKTIVVLGSSTSAGYGLTPSSDAYVNRFATYFNALKTGNNVVNLAVGGYTTYDIMPTGSTPPGGRPSPNTSHNITTALTYSPSAIIINMPSNDSVAGYSAAEQESNYQTLVTTATNAGVPVWITTTQPRNGLSAGQMTAQTTVRDWISTTYGTHAIDFWTTFANPNGTIVSTYDQGDGIHLNNGAHKKLYARVAESNLITTLIADVNPTANAGTDQSITLPTASTTLSGSGSDTDGTIASYAWTLVSGPTTPTIVSASSASTSVTGLSSAGTYIFRLTVTDDRGGTGTDDVNVTVNSAANQTPTANAGSDQVVNLPTTSTTLSGSGSDTDGTIASYAWSFISGPATPTIVSASSASTSVTGLSSAGTYAFRLTVTDNQGATGIDDIAVLVNTAPTANAGSDQVINASTATTTLSGSGSDTDGTIASYAWTLVSGPTTPTIVSASSVSTAISGLSAVGTYVFRLTVTDNRGGTGTDTLSILVNSLPTANAGSDVIINQPTSSMLLTGSGSDTDGTIASYAWSFISGPATPTIVSASSASTSVTGLSSAGTYVLQLAVTDDQNATNTDTVQIIVNSAPTADAGTDQSITLPTASVTLSGSGSDTDGAIVSYEWAVTSSPATPTIVSSSSDSTSVTGLSAAGEYIFELTVTDDDGATGTDTVSIDVANASSSGGGGGGGGGGSSHHSSSSSSSATTPTDTAVPVVVTPAPVTPTVPTVSTNGIRTTASVLNVRSVPNGQIVAKVSLGTTGTPVAGQQSVAGWMNVLFANGVSGWVSTQYVLPITVPATAPTPTGSGTVYVTATKLNVRATPGGSILKTVLRGTTATIRTSAGGWANVTLSDGTIGWVSSTYISATTPAVLSPTSAVIAATPVQTAVAKPFSAGTAVTVAVRVLNVRSSADGSIVGKVVSGTNGITADSEDNWTNVSFESGMRGWVWTAYLKQGHTAAPAPSQPAVPVIPASPAAPAASTVSNQVTVTAPMLIIYEQPGEREVGVVSKDTTGTVLHDTGGVWVNVEFSHGLAGYVERSGLSGL